MPTTRSEQGWGLLIQKTGRLRRVLDHKGVRSPINSEDEALVRRMKRTGQTVVRVETRVIGAPRTAR